MLLYTPLIPQRFYYFILVNEQSMPLNCDFPSLSFFKHLVNSLLHLFSNFPELPKQQFPFALAYI